MDPARLFGLVGCLAAGSAVALGAFAAHGLKPRLTAAALATFDTAVTYHFLHALALCLVALWARALAAPFSHPVALAGAAFAVGIVLFSGSLYALALGGPRWLGPVTPLGGIAFLAGWVLFAWAVWRT